MIHVSRGVRVGDVMTDASSPAADALDPKRNAETRYRRRKPRAIHPNDSMNV